MFLEQPFGDLALSPHRYGINIEKSSLSPKELSWSRGKKPKDSETPASKNFFATSIHVKITL